MTKLLQVTHTHTHTHIPPFSLSLSLDRSIDRSMFQHIKNFLSHRCICTRVNKTYSSNKNIDVGIIPHGSVIAPIVFAILIHDLPKTLSKNAHVAQYTDDIATMLFQKKGYDFNACISVTYIVYNSDVITSTAKCIVHSPVS